MLIEIIILTLIIEIFSIIGRILFDSMKERYKKNKLPFKSHVHHGYMGIVIILAYFFYHLESFLIVGMALFFSDVIHHFIVLPVWIGRTEFP